MMIFLRILLFYCITLRGKIPGDLIKVIQHNHILFACAQIENELLQCMNSNDFHSLDNMNEVLEEISSWRRE